MISQSPTSIYPQQRQLGETGEGRRGARGRTTTAAAAAGTGRAAPGPRRAGGSAAGWARLPTDPGTAPGLRPAGWRPGTVAGRGRLPPSDTGTQFNSKKLLEFSLEK